MYHFPIPKYHLDGWYADEEPDLSDEPLPEDEFDWDEDLEAYEASKAELDKLLYKEQNNE